MNLKKLAMAAVGGAVVLTGLLGCGGGGGSAASTIRMITVGDNGAVGVYRVEGSGATTQLFTDAGSFDWVSVVPGRVPGYFYLSASDTNEVGVLALVDDTDLTGDFVATTMASGGKLFKHPTKNALYVMHSGLDVIEQYSISLDGNLAPLAIATAPTDDQPTSMVFSADGNYAYVVCEGDEVIRAYQVSPTGIMTQMPGEVYSAGNGARKAVISDDGANIYVMSSATNFRQAMVNGNGTLTPLNPVDVAYPMANFRAAITGLNTLCFYRESDEGIETFGRNPNGTMSDLSATNFATSGPVDLFRMPGQNLIALLSTGSSTVKAVQMGANGVGTEVGSVAIPTGTRDLTFISIQ